MAHDEVQRAVDELAETLERSVVINDPEVRMLYASRHFGDEDPVRVKAVLNRDAGSEAIGHVLAQGILQWTRPQRIPPLESIGLRPRVGVAIRWEGEALGMLLVMDADESLAESALDHVREVAAMMAPLMAASRDDTKGRLESTVAALLDRRDSSRRAALEALKALVDHPLEGKARVITLLVSLASRPDDPVVPVALRHALTAARSRRRGVTVSAVGVGLGHGLGHVVAIGAPELTDSAARQVAEIMVSDARALMGSEPQITAGIGSMVPGVELAWRSAREAALTAEGARRAGGPTVADWDRAGIDTLLARVPMREIDSSMVPPELAVLARADPSGRLVETLRTFLDLAGSAPATADALFIHRTTLYYRLDRIRDLTSVDLSDGRTRTRLHVGLSLLDARPDLLDL